MSELAIHVEDLSFAYDGRAALRNVSFDIHEGEIFGFLGPNGSGKSTLFKVLATLLTPRQGEVSVCGFDSYTQPRLIRNQIGVVFQSFGLDKKLTVFENLAHQGHLYGLAGKKLRGRIDEVLNRLGVLDRKAERVEKLSGGLQRRVELAKGILHQPRIVLMDEPSTGLDPGARIEFWKYLLEVRDSVGSTILLTTHILEEAEKCDRLAIIDQGELVGMGAPKKLKEQIGGDIISVRTHEPGQMVQRIKSTFGGEPLVVNDVVHIERAEGHLFIPKLIEAFPGEIESVTVGKPTLEDVFIRVTGHLFWNNSRNGVVDP